MRILGVWRYLNFCNRFLWLLLWLLMCFVTGSNSWESVLLSSMGQCSPVCKCPCLTLYLTGNEPISVRGWDLLVFSVCFYTWNFQLFYNCRWKMSRLLLLRMLPGTKTHTSINPASFTSAIKLCKPFWTLRCSLLETFP